MWKSYGSLDKAKLLLVTCEHYPWWFDVCRSQLRYCEVGCESCGGSKLIVPSSWTRNSCVETFWVPSGQHLVNWHHVTFNEGLRSWIWVIDLLVKLCSHKICQQNLYKRIEQQITITIGLSQESIIAIFSLCRFKLYLYGPGKARNPKSE